MKQKFSGIKSRNIFSQLFLIMFFLCAILCSPLANDCESNGVKDYFSGEDLLNLGICKGAEAGAGAVQDVLSDLGKNVLAAALNSYIPGLGGLLGLGGGSEDPFKEYFKAIIDRINMQHKNTRDLINRFWSWAENTVEAEYYIAFDTAKIALTDWGSMTLEESPYY